MPGYRLDRRGVDFASGILGDLASVNFVSGSRGWILRSDGSGEMNSLVVNLANVRGTLTADHLAGDIRNWFLLRSATATIPIAHDSRTQTGPSFTLLKNVSSYDTIFFVGQLAGINFSTFVSRSSLSSLRIIATWDRIRRRIIRDQTLSLSLAVRLSGTTMSTQTGADDAGGTAFIYEVWGLLNPAS